MVFEHAQIIRHWVCDTSPTSLCIILYFVTRIQKEHKDALYHFNFTMVCTAGKKTKETAPSADTKLETTAVVHRAAMPEPEEEPTTCEDVKTNYSILKGNIFICIFYR